MFLELAELNLVEGKRSSRNLTNELLDVIDRLLVLTSDVAVGNESLKTTPEFRAELGEFRKLVADLDPESGKSIQVLAESFLQPARDFSVKLESTFSTGRLSSSRSSMCFERQYARSPVILPNSTIA